MTRSYQKRRITAGPVPAFSCEHCGRIVPGTAPGTENRNHCPFCLTSLHVDITVGDRRSGCRAPMEAIAVWVKKNGEWALVHRCERCGKTNTNRVAGDDDERVLRELMRRGVG
jgi:RNHCP domain